MRGLGLGLGNPAGLVHFAEHPVAARHCGVLVGGRTVVFRSFGQSAEEGHFRGVELVDRLAEIVESCGADTVGSITEIDVVQIQLEDLFLRQRIFQPARQDDFLELAPQRALIVQQEILGDLLRDGRTAFEAASAQQVEDVFRHGAADAADVDAVVRKEVAVFGRQESLGQTRRDTIIGDVDAALLAVFTDQGAVPGKDARRSHGVEIGQLRPVGHVVKQPGSIDRHGETGQADYRHHGDADHRKQTLGRLYQTTSNPPDFGGAPHLPPTFTKCARLGKAIRRNFPSCSRLWRNPLKRTAKSPAGDGRAFASDFGAMPGQMAVAHCF